MFISGVCNITHAYAPPSEDRHSPVRYRSARKLADEESQRAIQLSLEEVGAANSNGRHSRPGYTPSQPDPSAYSKWRTSEPPLVDRSSRPRAADDEENDPNLRAAIKESLREANAPKASAPGLWRALLLRLLASRTHRHHTLHQPQLPMQPLESDVTFTFRSVGVLQGTQL